MNLRFSPAQFVLSAVCGVLSAVLLYLLFAPLPEYSQPVPRARPAPAEVISPARFEAPPKEAFAQVDDRSVFNPLRTKVEDAGTESGTGAASLPSDLALVGVILDGETRLALIKSPSEPLAVGVSAGGTIEGWQVASIEPDRVVLRAGGSEQELKLSANKPTGAPAPGNQPPGAQQPQRPNTNNQNNSDDDDDSQ